VFPLRTVYQISWSPRMGGRGLFFHCPPLSSIFGRSPRRRNRPRTLQVVSKAQCFFFRSTQILPTFSNPSPFPHVNSCFSAPPPPSRGACGKPSSTDAKFRTFSSPPTHLGCFFGFFFPVGRLFHVFLRVPGGFWVRFSLSEPSAPQGEDLFFFGLFFSPVCRLGPESSGLGSRGLAGDTPTHRLFMTFSPFLSLFVRFRRGGLPHPVRGLVPLDH